MMVERIHAPASIERDSPMTPEYRAALIKLLADQARAELAAAHEYSRWVCRVPGTEEKMQLAAIAKDETAHWYRTMVLLAELGIDAEAAARHRTRSWFYPAVRLFMPRLTWLD